VTENRCEHPPEHWEEWEVKSFMRSRDSDPVYTGVTISCGLCGFDGEIPFNKENLDRAFSHHLAAGTIAKAQSDIAIEPPAPVMKAAIDWNPISTMPFGQRVTLYFEHGEKGNGEIDTNWVYPEDESSDQAARAGRWSYWTWGGPNAGSDFERDEKPVLWADPEPLVGSALRALQAASKQ
jgi:hypothetical protein